MAPPLFSPAHDEGACRWLPATRLLVRGGGGLGYIMAEGESSAMGFGCSSGVRGGSQPPTEIADSVGASVFVSTGKTGPSTGVHPTAAEDRDTCAHGPLVSVVQDTLAWYQAACVSTLGW